MRLKQLFILCLFFTYKIQGFNSKPISKKSLTKLHTFESIDFQIPDYKYEIIKKSKAFYKMIRPQNIFPTALLCFSGAFISNPFQILSKRFAVSTMITMIIMSNSMIINDIFDMKIDKINNPSRPLITGEITKKEAFGASSFLIMLSEMLNVLYLPTHIRPIVRLANLFTLIYTPILKKNTYLKNLACATLVSFSVLFSGIVVDPINSFYKNIFLLGILSNSVFTGSFITEVLLDIHDKDGDQKNNIITLPIKYGNEKCIHFVRNLLIFNIFMNMLLLTYMYTWTTGFAFTYISMQMFVNLEEVKKYNYSALSIRYAMNRSVRTLSLIVFYLCVLSAISML
jgi:geranylgeranylglycerol-phosphate geranylgeranyltransferase